VSGRQGCSAPDIAVRFSAELPRQFAFGDIPVIDNDRFHDMIFDEIASHGFQCAIVPFL
jgi:hypothetical protein